jgi:hypothetical protein
MNERILELARQSGGIDMTNHVAGGTTTWVGTGTPEFLERFAELIVRECASIIEAGKVGCNQVPAEVALDLTAKNVKAYFGVEQ